MAKKDCIFLISYCMTFVSFILFLVAFSSANWISYEEGHRGLWKECTKNETKSAKDECSATTLAEGPAFLDVTRTLMCFALVAYVIAVYGYIFSESGDVPQTCKGQMKARLQETAYIIGGLLGISASIVYGKNYSDYHSNELNLTNPKFDFAFIVNCVAASVTVVFAFLLACSRDTGLKKTIRKKTRSFKLEKAPNKPQANKRNIWLKKKDMPTPINQKNESILVVEEEKTEVPIKTKNLARFILPVTVIQAARRLQKGASREDEKIKNVDDSDKTNFENKEIPMNINNNEKYKGIFTINIDNRMERSPSPVQETPRVRIQTPTADLVSTSSEEDASSTETSSSSDDELAVNVGGRAVAGAQPDKSDAAAVGKSPTSKTVDESKMDEDKTETKQRVAATTVGNSQRPSVRRSKTTLGRGEEPEWTRYTTLQSPQRPPPPQKTLSFGPVHKKTSKRPKQVTIPESNVNIYTLPPEPGPVRPNTAINYEEVLAGGRVAAGNEPQPVTTHQSTIYKPYS